MSRPNSLSSIVTLTLCLVSSFPISVPCANAGGRLPDSRILSAAPLNFHADKEIFSRLPAKPVDSRIFSPNKPERYNGDSRVAQTRFDHAQMI
jgi:hypothetical protein